MNKTRIKMGKKNKMLNDNDNFLHQQFMTQSFMYAELFKKINL